MYLDESIIAADLSRRFFSCVNTNDLYVVITGKAFLFISYDPLHLCVPRVRCQFITVADSRLPSNRLLHWAYVTCKVAADLIQPY